MKVCPRCQKTYADDNLNFCLDDGNVLTQAGAAQETVMMSQARPTNPQPAVPVNQSPQQAWNNLPQYQAAPRKSSKAWLLVLGILGVVVLLCGGGFVGLALIGMNAENQKTNSSTWPSPANTRSVTTSSSPEEDSTSDVETIDLSGWNRNISIYGTSEYDGDELILSTREKGYYYVLAATDNYSTGSASTRVTLRNINDSASSLGYGLVFHSNPTPLTQDYAFLIDTKRKRYRVVRHEPQKETALISWTNSPAINGGSEENVLEVRDKGDVTELYINGQMVNTVKNNFAFKNGVPGLYSGDAVKVAFKNLEIRK